MSEIGAPIQESNLCTAVWPTTKAGEPQSLQVRGGKSIELAEVLSHHRENGRRVLLEPQIALAVDLSAVLMRLRFGSS
jgi:hypothetical protein